MERLEHTENLVLRISRSELRTAIIQLLGLDPTWQLDDLDVMHEGPELSATFFLTRPRQLP